MDFGTLHTIIVSVCAAVGSNIASSSRQQQKKSADDPIVLYYDFELYGLFILFLD